MTELSEAYDRYWAQRKAYQKADRESLDARLAPERERLGRAIHNELQTSSMDGVQAALGTKNRNFLYSAMQGIEYIKYIKPKEKAATVPATDITESESEAVQENSFDIEYLLDEHNTAVVSTTYDGTEARWEIQREYVPSSNTFELQPTPQEWLDIPMTDSEQRKFFKTVIAKLRAND